MLVPQIGENVSTERAFHLCELYGLTYLSNRILFNQAHYKPWAFDGISGANDRVLSWILGVDQRTLTYQCALPHDLAYAYGMPSEMTLGRERREADRILYRNLVRAGVARPISGLMYSIVRVFGSERFGFSFSWAFASS